MSYSLKMRSRLLVQQCGVGSRVVGLNHVDGKGVILAWVAQTVGDVRLGLAVAADVLYIQVQQVVIFLQQWLIGRAQEVIRSVVDVQPYILGRMSSCIQLVGNRSVNLGGIHEVLIVFSGNCNVQSVVGALVSIVVVYVVAEHVASVVLGADTGVNINAVQS